MRVEKSETVEATEPTGRINVELLERVKQHILEEPRRYDQSVFGRRSREAPCGTAACIAGWTAVLGGAVEAEQLRSHYGDIRKTAQGLLGLNEEEAAKLFHGEPTCECGVGWPKRFARRYYKAKTTRGRASAAAAFIDHIIRTGKVG
jgi:hypothetical protein